jgi:hypothetical protein
MVAPDLSGFLLKELNRKPERYRGIIRLSIKKDVRMEELNKWLPLMQLVVGLFIVPLLRAAYYTIQNQEIQIGELKIIITAQQKQIDLLEAIVLEAAAPEIIKKHLIHRGDYAKH